MKEIWRKKMFIANWCGRVGGCPIRHDGGGGEAVGRKRIKKGGRTEEEVYEGKMPNALPNFPFK